MKQWHKPVKRGTLTALLCVLLAALSSCNGNGVPIKEGLKTTLPPATVTYVPPIGDAALEYSGPATFYLPRNGGSRLISLSDEVAFSAARLDAESILRAMLLHPGNGVANAIGGDVKLSLYGANPVEVSGDVATVNLAASALQLDRKALYICSQAITNTLTELGSIKYVNLLVMDKQIGLDLASTLPEGALTRSVGGDVGAVYEQVLSQRVETDENPADKGLTSTVALYFPLAGINGVMSEARNVTFTSQSPSDMALQLIRQLSEGPVTVRNSPTLPNLADMLAQHPEISEPANGGGKLITLRFTAELDAMLQNAGLTRANGLASICYTLCTFMPNITGLVVYIGDERVDHLMLNATAGLLFESGVQQRANYATFLMDNCDLYFSDADGKELVKTQRPLPYYQRTNPRALLLELFKGPGSQDSVQGLKAVVPNGLLNDADILGLSLNEQTLLVNLSANFSKAGAGISHQQDRLMAYAIVNTLLCGKNANRVCFFVAGNTPRDFTGEIYWAGLFYPNFGLAHAG